MLQTVRAEKVEEKNGSIVPFQCFLPELWSLNCLKKCIFCNFVLTSATNLNLSKQFAFLHIKGLVNALSENGIIIMPSPTVRRY